MKDPGPAEAGRHVLRYTFGALLAIAALWVSLRQVDHEAVRDAMHFHPVSDVRDVLAIALEDRAA